jgi:hypothetical protein
LDEVESDWRMPCSNLGTLGAVGWFVEPLGYSVVLLGGKPEGARTGAGGSKVEPLGFTRVLGRSG